MRRGIVLVVAVGLVVAACGSDDSESGGPVEVAEAVIETWNGGDVPAFFDWFAEGATIQGDSIDTPGLYSDLGFYMGLGQNVSIEECSLTGENQVTCTTLTSDELSGPLGVETPVTWVIDVMGDEVASLLFAFPPASQPDLFVVATDAVLWVRDAHPDVFDATFRLLLCEHDWNAYPDLWCAFPEGAEELLRLGDDFRAQYGS